MIKKVKIQNFRSIEKQDIELSPFTVIYGPTATGKSSLLYSILVLKNFFLNPNQTVDGFFNLGFISLGSFDSVIFNNQTDRNISVSVLFDEGEIGLSLSKNNAKICLKTEIIKLEGEIPIPYPLNKNFTFNLKYKNEDFIVNWNGITATVQPKHSTPETQQIAAEIAHSLNSVYENFRKLEVAPHRRGFYKPIYVPSQIVNLITDDEVATLIINDPNLVSRISVDLEEITGRDFRIHTYPGTANTELRTTEKKGRIPTLLVNDGFGVNQIVYILAKIYRTGTKTILIEEPEVHLHPSVIRSLVRTFCRIVKEEGKQLILTTHSEIFVSSLLSRIRENTISPRDVKCYLTQKIKKNTTFHEQKINENGQIEGGLSSFMEGELEDLKIFFEKI